MISKQTNTGHSVNQRIIRARSTNKVLRVIPLISLLFAVIAAVLLVFKPVDSTSTKYNWDPISQSDSGVFPLDRSWPEKLDISFVFSCEEDVERRIVSLGGMEIYCTNGAVEVVSGKEKIKKLTGLVGNQFSVVFIADDASLTVTNETSTKQISTVLDYSNFPRVTQLDSPEPLNDKVKLSLVTRADSVQFSWIRFLLFCSALIFAFLSVLLLGTKFSPTNDEVSNAKPYIKQGIFVGIGLVVAAFATPMFYDDGWVFQRISQFIQTGYLGDFYFHSNAWLPQGFVTEFILALLVNAGLPYLGIRILVAIILFLTWFVCLKSVLILRGQISQSTAWISTAAFLAIAGAWSVSLRAESWVSLFLSIQFFFIVKYYKFGSIRDFFFSGVFASLAIATHQSGMIAIVGAIGVVYIALVQHKERNRGQLYIAVVAIFAFFLAVFFVGYDIFSIFSSVKDFADSAYDNRLNEFNRIGEIAGTAISSARKFGFLLAVFVFGLSLFLMHLLSRVQKFFVILLLCYPLGLLLTSSKWGWHFAVIAVPIFLILSLSLNQSFNGQNKPQVKYSILLPIVSLCIGISLASKGSWGTYDHRNFTWEAYSEFFAGVFTNYVWYLLAAILFIIGKIIDSRSNRRKVTVGTWFLVALIMFPFISSVSWILADSFFEIKPGINTWTLLRQNLKIATGINPNSCGILGSVAAFDLEVQKLSVLQNETNSERLKQTKATLFGWEGIDSWNSSQAKDLIANTPFYGVAASQESNKHYSTWWTSSLGYPDENPYISISYLYQNGQINSQVFEVTVPKVGGVWSELKIPIPEGAIGISLGTYGNEYSYIVLTEPLLVTDGNAKSVLASGSTFIAPSFLPAVPCATLPAAKNGLFPIPNFVISLDYNLDTRMWIDQYFAPGSMMITHVGQVEQNTPSIWRVKFDQANRVTSEQLPKTK